MSAQTDLAREAVDHLSALITIAPQLSGELAFPDADSLDDHRLRLHGRDDVRADALLMQIDDIAGLQYLFSRNRQIINNHRIVGA